MAPEQIQGKPRPASDQYALGIVVYEWLTGARPFEGTATEIAMQHVLSPPAPFTHKVPALSREVEQVVLTALSKDPHQRFRTIQAFATALEQASQLKQPGPGAVPPAEALTNESTPALCGAVPIWCRPGTCASASVAYAIKPSS